MMPAIEYPSSSMTFSDDDINPLARTRNMAGTRFGRRACLAGLEKALAAAIRKTAMNTPGSHRTAKNGMVIVRNARIRSAPIISRWRSVRSTNDPATRPKRIVGAAFAINPSATTDGDLVIR